MEDKTIRVLVIEDEVSVSRIIEEILRQAKGFRFDVEIVKKLETGLERLSQPGIDVILVDLGLPDSSGFETFEKIKKAAPHTPIIIITGLRDDKLALQAVQQGAQDYLVKGELDVMALPRTLAFAIERADSPKRP